MKKILLLLTAFISMAVSAATVGDRYSKVNSTGDIVVGEEYILCYETFAMGAQSGKFRASVADGITLDGDVAVINSEAVSEFKLVAGTVADSFSFDFGTAFWACTGTANNSTSEVTAQDDNSNFTISVTDGVATIIPVANSNSNQNKMQYNSNSGQERFSNYKTGTQKNCTLYKKVTGTVIPDPITVEMPVITFDETTSTVSITCATEDAVIYYTLDGSTPDETSTLYTEAFTVSESCTVQAIAIKEGVSSDIASQEVVVLAQGDNVTISFTNPNGWTAVYCYCWIEGGSNNANWPGQPMTQSGEVWTIDLGDFMPDKVIFNNGSGAQTSNLSFVAGATYDMDGIIGAEIPEHTVYFENTDNWEKVYVYMWDGYTNSWPGEQMTLVEGNLYKFVFKCEDVSNQLLIFNNGDGTQTGNLKYVEGATYDKNGVVGAEIPEHSVYFENTDNWATVNVYMWGGYTNGWPGEQMTLVEGNLYKFVFKCEDVSNQSLIFNNGAGAQTGDITNFVDGATYLPNGTIKGEGPVEPVAPVFYVRGLGGNWDANDTTMMTEDGNGVYTYSVAAISAGETFKIACANWDDGQYSTLNTDMALDTEYDMVSAAGYNTDMAMGTDITDATITFDYNKMTIIVTGTVSSTVTPLEAIFDFVNDTYGMGGEAQDRSNSAPYFTEASCTNEGVTLSVKTTAGNGLRYWSDGLRIYKTGDGEADFKIEVNGTITDIVITYAKEFTTVKLDGNDFVKNTSDKTYTWTGSIENEANVVITQTGGNNAMSGLAVTYIPGEVDPNAVAKPVITYDDLTSTVSMTCDTEEAAIHYTLDGTTPDETSTLYTEPFTVAESCTVQAVAIKNGYTSPVASKDVTVLESAKSIAELLAMAPAKDDKAIVGCELTVVYVNGLNVYVIDAFGGSTLLYANNSYKAGDVIPAGWEATCSPFNGLIEYKGTFPAATGTAEFTIPEVASVTAEDMNRVVTITNVTFTEATPGDKSNFDGILEDGSTLLFRNNFTIDSTDRGIYNVKCAVAVYNSNVQVYPIEYTLMGVLMDQVEKPVFSPAGGTITEATDVTITCDTEDAVIYYTLDGTTPDETSTVYDGPIIVSESTIIKAVAYATYMLASDVATAEFIYDDGTGPKYEMGTATFIFNTPEGVTELGFEVPEKSSSTSVDNKPIVKEPITILAQKGSATTEPRFWQATNFLDLRLYKGNTLTISAANGADIREIVFEGYTVKNITCNDTALGTDDNKETWTASDAAVINSSVEFAFEGSTRIDTITVTYMSTTGVANVAADDENAPVEYYNLQGVRIEEPAAGLYIRRQGNQVSKVVIR